ncbi:MAG: hypothetical protein LBN20_01100 [Endomicrobium sp.]|jgi:acetyl-CoA carboxylase biotin carboxyl carrier protein|nr:hypothetical protein [Endomicrobium sp.]
MENTDIKSTVKSLYDIMTDEYIQELEVNSKDYSVSIKRKSEKTIVAAAPPKSVQKQELPIEQSQDKTQIQESTAPLKVQIASENAIKSPITGIFYRAASPASPVFVNEGDIVEAGKVICIIEAMKVMNEIKASSKVKIVKILSENSKSVEAGQDLFEIEKM